MESFDAGYDLAESRMHWIFYLRNNLHKTGMKQMLSLMQTAAWDFHLLESTPQAEAHMHCIRASRKTSIITTGEACRRL